MFGRARTVPNPTFAAFEPEGLVHHWLEACLSSHEKCRIDAPQALPTRVIDVFGNECSKGQPFLYESQGEIEPYVCLSYCWGGISFLMTTSATLEHRKNCIAWEELPQTLSDAIWITRSLGVRYLWIDALCIVQDDPDDWMRESTSMITVYGHSYLTIAASEAPNAASGMFYATQYSVDNPAQVKVTCSEDPQASVIVRRRLPHWDFETESPLSRRGWAFQESILPKRIVRLGLHEPLWECDQISTCCCTPNPLNNEGLKTKIASALGRIDDVTTSERWNIWSEIVFDYTSRALTRGTDKLVALSGTANSIQAIWNCRYFAGLWEADILMGLRWQINGRVKRKSRPQPFRAPTWSWASVDEHVFYPNPYHAPHPFYQATLVDVHCDLESDNPVGLISRGQITLSGKLVQLDYIYESHSEAGLFEGFIQCDSLYFNNQHQSFQADVELVSMTSEDLPEVQEAYCLLLGAYGEESPPPPEPAVPDEAGQECCILVLQKCPGSPNRFQRIGILDDHSSKLTT